MLQKTSSSTIFFPSGNIRLWDVHLGGSGSWCCPWGEIKGNTAGAAAWSVSSLVRFWCAVPSRDSSTFKLPCPGAGQTCSCCLSQPYFLSSSAWTTEDLGVFFCLTTVTGFHFLESVQGCIRTFILGCRSFISLLACRTWYFFWSSLVFFRYMETSFWLTLASWIKLSIMGNSFLSQCPISSCAGNSSMPNSGVIQ